jgi:glycolate dehydrogenase FAD-binding subunit
LTALAPASAQEASQALCSLAQAGTPVRVRGAGTKDCRPSGEGTVELRSSAMSRIVEHNEGDFTAVLEPGARLADAQAAFAKAGQMLALDPPLGEGDAATVGGVVASADSGPLRHRFGGVRDLLVGITVVLSDGTVATAGGKVIKNVAGYDLGKLFAGSRGTLGYIASVTVRLHPAPGPTATARAESHDPRRLSAAAARMAALPLEADCLDVGWTQGRGAVLVRFGGQTAADQARGAADRLADAGLTDAEVVTDDDELWALQRARQRVHNGAVAKVSGVIGDLGAVIAAAENIGATVVSRAALGLSWIAVPGGEDLDRRIEQLRRSLPPSAAIGAGDALPSPAPGAVALMQRIKARFDPARIFPELTFGEAAR